MIFKIILWAGLGISIVYGLYELKYILFDEKNELRELVDKLETRLEATNELNRSLTKVTAKNLDVLNELIANQKETEVLQKELKKETDELLKRSNVFIEEIKGAEDACLDYDISHLLTGELHTERN